MAKLKIVKSLTEPSVLADDTLYIFPVGESGLGFSIKAVNGEVFTNKENVSLEQITSALAGKVDKDGSKVLTDVNFTAAMKTKLDGIATGATKNATDAQLRARSSHTGTQAISTISGLQAALDSKSNSVYGEFVNTEAEMTAAKNRTGTTIYDLLNNNIQTKSGTTWSVSTTLTLASLKDGSILVNPATRKVFFKHSDTLFSVISA